MKKYINFQIFKVVFLVAFLLLSTQVSLTRAETRSINSNLNNALDLQAMAIQIEQIRLEEMPPEPEPPVAPRPQPEIRNEGAMAHTQDDLWWLALAIHYEAGSNWLSDEHQLKVGNVVLNRVAHHRFAGTTIHAILHQPGQYPWATRSSHVQPSERALRNAQRLLNGERLLPSDVVFQAQFRQGRSCYSIIRCDVLRSTTYFCHI